MVTLFSMFAEYWVRGRYTFQKPIYEWIIMFVFYFALFKMADDLVRRFRLKDYQLFLFAATFGMVQETFNTGGAVGGVTVFGINPGGIIFPLLMWGVIQTLLGFYFGRRVLGMSMEHRKMGKLGWALAIGINVVVLIGVLSEKKSFGTFMGYGICILIVAILLFMLIRSIKRSQPQEEAVANFKRVRLLDLVITIYFIVGIISGTFLTGELFSGPTDILEFGKVSTGIFGIYTIIHSNCNTTGLQTKDQRISPYLISIL